jgi:hypothetical protein
VPVHFAERLLLADEEGPRPLGNRRHDRDAERQRHQHDQRHDPADRQHHDDDADDRQHRANQLRQVLLQRAADVVEIVDGAAQDLAVRARIKKSERQPAELGLDVAAQRIDGVLRDARHQVLLHVEERGADDIENRQPGQHRPDVGKVHPAAAGGARQIALEDLRRRLAEQLRSDHAEQRGDDAGADHDRQPGLVGPQVAAQAAQRPFEVLRFLDGHAEAAHRAAAEDARRRRLRFQFHAFVAHATSSSDACDSAISR